MYGFTFEHCGGTVRERRMEGDALRHKGSFVILEDVPVGVCDRCGARYFDASILRRVAEIGRGTTPSPRTIEVPVAPYGPA
jgi:YgiT-type zinc finger domain-containing protein